MLARPKEAHLSFADLEISRQIPVKDSLAAIARLIDWPALAVILAALYPSPVGRPSHPPLMLFQALLLRRWFRLSDPGLEAQLRDRLSWRRFCGLSLADRIPDETTFCRFRRRLQEAGLHDSLLQQVEEQIRAAGQSWPGRTDSPRTQI